MATYVYLLTLLLLLAVLGHALVLLCRDFLRHTTVESLRREAELGLYRGGFDETVPRPFPDLLGPLASVIPSGGFAETGAASAGRERDLDNVVGQAGGVQLHVPMKLCTDRASAGVWATDEPRSGCPHLQGVGRSVVHAGASALPSNARSAASQLGAAS